MALNAGVRLGPYAARAGRIGIAATILALLLLDFAALDDVTTGNQPHFYMEYVMLGVSLPLFVACWRGLSRLCRSAKPQP
jgi:hypothetical protein